MGRLAAAGMVYREGQAICGSDTMVIREVAVPNGFMLVSDFVVVNTVIGDVVMPMLNLEQFG